MNNSLYGISVKEVRFYCFPDRSCFRSATEIKLWKGYGRLKSDTF